MADDRRQTPRALAAATNVQSGLRLDELLAEVQERLVEVIATRGRMQGLLDAVLAVGAGLELDTTLRRIVAAAVDLVDARYGALAVLAPNGSIARFIHVGLDDATVATMGRLPEGRGLLNRVVLGGRPLRLADLGTHQASVGFPPNHPPMRRFLGVSVQVGGAAFGNLYLTDKEGGGEFTADDEIVVEALAAAAGIAVQNANLFEQGQLRQRWLEASAEIRNELLSGVTEADAIDLIAQRTLELTDSDATVVVLGPDPAGRFVLRSRRGDDDVVGARTDGTDPLLQEVVNMRTAVLRTPGPDGPRVAVPLLSRDVVVGVLVAVRHLGREPFGPAEVPLLTSFAEQAVLALEFGERLRARRQLDVSAERDRMARELHDRVIQRLFAVGLQLQGTLRRTRDEAVAQRISQAVGDLDGTVREIRTTIFDLQTTGDGAAGGLRRRLLDTAAEAAAGSGLTPAVRMAGTLDTLVSPDIGAHALAVVREAVSNVVRHAGASTVTVTVEAGEDLLIDVLDDGVGIDPGAARSGLVNLVTRAQECGGELVVRPGPTKGTRLSWRVPLR